MGLQKAGTAIRHRLRRRKSLPAPEERRRLREQSGLSAREIGLAVGVTGASVLRWETGVRQPRGAFLDAYLDVLDTLRQELENDDA